MSQHRHPPRAITARSLGLGAALSLSLGLGAAPALAQDDERSPGAVTVEVQDDSSGETAQQQGEATRQAPQEGLADRLRPGSEQAGAEPTEAVPARSHDVVAGLGDRVADRVSGFAARIRAWLERDAERVPTPERSDGPDDPAWTAQRYPALIVLAALGSQLDSRRSDLAFSRKADITMRELKYWRFSYTDRGAFEQAAAKLSLDLVNQCEHPSLGAERKGALTVGEARAALEQTIREAGNRLVDVAVRIDAMYDFQYDEARPE